MAWLCCTVVPQRECLWLRWGLLALQTFSPVLPGEEQSSVCFTYSVTLFSCSHVFSLCSHRHICTYFLCSFVEARAAVDELQTPFVWFFFSSILEVPSNPCASLRSLSAVFSGKKGLTTMTYLDAVYSFHSRRRSPLSLFGVWVFVCVSERESLSLPF